MDDAVSALRRFNRFFTEFVGALDADFLQTGMSLAEARVLFELAQRESCIASDIQETLDLDAAFLSRILARFEARFWIERARVEADGRRRSIALTPSGRRQFEVLDRRQLHEVRAVLSRLDALQRDRLVAALGTVQGLLAGRDSSTITLRTFRPGDMGLIVSRQALLYTQIYGWNDNVEVNESEVTAAFLKNFKPGREQCWIAEMDGMIAGSIFLTDEGGGLSRLRLLYVEPMFQGRGIGDTLVRTCVAFARSAGYERVTLWTHAILEGARRIYARHGFEIVATKEHDLFGPMQIGETWELKL